MENSYYDIMLPLEDIENEEDYYQEEKYDLELLDRIIKENHKGIKISKWIWHTNDPGPLMNTYEKSDKEESWFEQYVDECPVPKTVKKFVSLIEKNKWGDHQFPETLSIDEDDFIHISYGS